MKEHVKILQKEFMVLTRLVKSDAEPGEYLKSMEIIQNARDWYELEAPGSKRLCAAAKRGGEPAKKSAKKA